MKKRRFKKSGILILMAIVPIAMIIFYGTTFFLIQGVMEVMSWFGIEKQQIGIVKMR